MKLATTRTFKSLLSNLPLVFFTTKNGDSMRITGIDYYYKQSPNGLQERKIIKRYVIQQKKMKNKIQ